MVPKSYITVFAVLLGENCNCYKNIYFDELVFLGDTFEIVEGGIGD